MESQIGVCGKDGIAHCACAWRAVIRESVATTQIWIVSLLDHNCDRRWWILSVSVSVTSDGQSRKVSGCNLLILISRIDFESEQLPTFRSQSV